MMRAVVFLLGVILGAVVAVGTTHVLATQPAAGAATADSVDKVRRAVEDAVSHAVRPRPAAADASDAASTMTRDPGTPARGKNAARLDQLVVRTKEAQAKRRLEWMFVSETALAGELGIPDEVIPLPKGGENWEYEVPYKSAEGEQRSGTLTFLVQRGRVVSVAGADDIPE